MHLAVSVGFVLIGLWFALMLQDTGGEHVFGWLVAGIGVLGLVSRWWLARQPDREPPPGRR